MDEQEERTDLSQISCSQSDILVKYKIIQPFLQKEESLLKIAHNHTLPVRTLRRWVASYRKEGIEGLAKKERKDKRKRRACSTALQKIIEGLYLSYPHLSIAAIYRKIKAHTLTQKEKCPSYRTVADILNQLPAGMKSLAHEGSKSYKQKFDLLYAHEANAPNECWQADHVLLDVLINRQDAREKPARPWLTVIMDDHSRVIAGYELSFMAPSSLKTALCLRHAIWRKQDPEWSVCGIPSKLYTDHGSDFTSQHIEQACLGLKIQLIFSTVGEPRGRGKIERFFRTLNQMLLCEIEGYIAVKNPSAKYTLPELDKKVCAFILHYNKRFHPSIKQSPKERREKNAFIPRMPGSLEELDLLLLTVAKPRMVRRDGIWFQGLRYLDPVLADYISESVVIRYDPRDVTSIRLFYKNQYLCQPICHALDNESITLKEIQNARIHRRKTLQKEINQRLSLVDALLNSKTKERALPKLPSPLIKSTPLKLYRDDDG